jgi:hypothetical protein
MTPQVLEIQLQPYIARLLETNKVCPALPSGAAPVLNCFLAASWLLNKQQPDVLRISGNE